MAHGLNPTIKLEIECSNVNIKSLNPSHSQISSNNNSTNSSVNSGTNQTAIGNSGTINAKMGSRRIFTPQFKLQVLESYRNDSDCKGNQRATARKYGIHRRQIQKWLQCENNLRSSVANLNQNNMKHQFHNISHHHHQIPVVSSSPATAITTTHTNNNNNNNNQQYKTNVLSLDTARHSVGLTSRPMTVQVPVPVPVVARATTSAIATPSTVMAALTPTRLTTTKCLSSSNVSGATATSTTSSSLKSPTHTITKIQAPPYNINMPVVPDTLLTHTPAIPSISSVPLVHHYPHHNTQHHAQNEQQQQQHQQSHHYQHHPQQQHENCLLMPSVSLPIPSSSSPVLTATNRTDELRDYQPITMTESCYMKEDYRNQEIYENYHYYTNESGFIAPIDLSLGPRRTVYQDDIQVSLTHNVNEDRPTMENTQTNVWPEIETNNNDCKDFYIKNEIQDPSQVDSQVIDLSCRKRKNYSRSNATAEKVPKTCHTDGNEPMDASNVRKSDLSGADNSQQVKPVKLFKPYLLDDESDDKKKVKSETHDPIIWSHHPNCTSPSAVYDSQSSRSSTFQSNEHGYPFPSGSPTFQKDTEHSNITTTAGTTPSPSNFIARTTPPNTTGVSLWCPKGSPVSGYDSASTYSDTSDHVYKPQHHYHHHHQQQQHYPPQCQTYSLDLKMQPIDSYYYDMTCRGDQLAIADKFNMHRNDVQRWLDHEADIRQGIAVYV